MNEHGIDEAFYSNVPRLRPVLVCLCGDAFVGDSWEDVGFQLDEHLKNVGKR